MIAGNWIHDGGGVASSLADHGGIGAGCHCPGGLYSDEGSTNWNITRNVVQRVNMWLQGCGELASYTTGGREGGG